MWPYNSIWILDNTLICVANRLRILSFMYAFDKCILCLEKPYISNTMIGCENAKTNEIDFVLE